MSKPLVVRSKRHKGKPRGFQLRLPLKKSSGQGITGSGLGAPDRGAVKSVCNQASTASRGSDV